MPNDVIKPMADKAEISVEKAEEKWEEAKEKAAEQVEKENYAYIMSIFKSMIGLKENEEELLGFKEFLRERRIKRIIEADISIDDAMQLLDLERGFSKEGLKKAYKKASMQYHPDRGGSTEIQKRVLDAYKKLQSVEGSNSSNSQNTQNKKNQARDIATRILESTCVQCFKDHFESLFGISMNVEIDDEITTDIARKIVQIYSDDRETFIKINFSIILSDVYVAMARGGLASNEDVIPGKIIFGYEILHNREKMKVKQQNVDLSNDVTVLKDPEVIFPKEKVKKKLLKNKDSDGVKKIKKRDALTTLRNKFEKSEVIEKGSDVIFVYRFDKQTIIQATRNTISRQGVWQIEFFENRKPIKETPTVMLPETNKTIDFIIRLVESVEKESDPKSTFVDMMQDAKKNESEFYAE